MTNEHDTTVEASVTRKTESAFRSVFRFISYFGAAWLTAAAATYLWFFPSAYNALRAVAVGKEGFADFEKIAWGQVAGLAFFKMDEVVTTLDFSIFAAICGVGAVLCRRSVK
jgi:hypothetical protein